MYRDTVSAANPLGLPTYILRFMSQGMVFVASLPGRNTKSYLPVMSCNSPRDEARCQGYNFVGHVPPGQSKQRKDRRRDGRTKEEIHRRRTGNAKDQREAR